METYPSRNWWEWTRRGCHRMCYAMRKLIVIRHINLFLTSCSKQYYNRRPRLRASRDASKTKSQQLRLPEGSSNQQRRLVRWGLSAWFSSRWKPPKRRWNRLGWRARTGRRWRWTPPGVRFCFQNIPQRQQQQQQQHQVVYSNVLNYLFPIYF